MIDYKNVINHINKLEEPTRSVVYSLFDDFCIIASELERVSKYPRYVIDPNNPKRQKKLPMHDVIKDLQTQKNDIATKILRALTKDGVEESALAKMLERFN